MAVHPREYVHFGWTVFSIVLANLLMLQAWIPVRDYYYSINAVSWSISDEFLFYLSFIVLIRPWRGGWRSKLFLGATLVLLSIALGEVIQKSHPAAPLELCHEYLPYVNPLCRIFEFILGMSIADLWLRWRQTIFSAGPVGITLIEVLALLLVIANIIMIPHLVQALPADQKPSALATWLLYSDGAPLFGVLIFVLALQKGAVSKLLAKPLFVWLGEISYSIYLVHMTFLRYALDPDVQQSYANLNNWLAFSLYLILVLLTAHLNFAFIETPFRKLFRRLSVSSVRLGVSPWRCLTTALQAVSDEIKTWSKGKRIVISIESVLTATLIILIVQNAELIKHRFHFGPALLGRNINFANKLLLEEAQLGYAKDGMKLRLILHSLGRNNPAYITRLVFYDSKGCIIANYEYPPDQARRTYLPGSSWTDDKEFASSKCKTLATIGLTIWYANPYYQLLPTNYRTELGGKVIIPVPQSNFQ
jgi:peptidoglycan/LPS O-acetylase OafA/YrhL